MSALASIAAFGCVFGAQNSANAQSLEDALALAYNTNPTLLAARASLRVTNETIAQARAGWRPTVSVSSTFGYADVDSKNNATNVESSGDSFPTTGGISLSQSLYAGGKTEASIKQADANIQAERATMFNSEQSVLFAGVTAYVDVIRFESELQLQVNNLRRLEKQLEATEDRFRVGEVTRTDVAQAESRVARAKADRSGSEGLLNAARVEFEKVFGIAPATLDQPVYPPGLPENRQAAVNAAVQGDFDLLNAVFDEVSAGHNVDNQFGDLLPSLDLVAQANQSYNTSGGDNETTTLTAELQLTIPIYQAGFNSAVVRQAKESQNQSRLLVEVARREAIDQSATAYESWQTNLATIDSLRAEVKAAEIALEGVEQEATVGARTVLDVLDAEQDLLNAQVSLVRSRRNAMVAAFQVLETMGRLTAQHLGLPVKYYDYDKHYRDARAKIWGWDRLD